MDCECFIVLALISLNEKGTNHKDAVLVDSQARNFGEKKDYVSRLFCVQ